jgi:putative ABC transport system permease protein
MVGTDLRAIWRGFARSPGFTALAVISLALGIGVNTAVFSLINALFWQSIRGVPEPGRVVLGPRVSAVELAQLRDGATTLDGLAGVVRLPVQLTFGDTSVASVVPLVSEAYFPTLRVAPRLGRLFDRSLTQPGSDARVAVLDYRFWRDHTGGDSGVVGRTVTINAHPFTIVGVAPERFHGAGPERPPLWLPLAAWPLLTGKATILDDPTAREVALIGRLRDGSSVGDAIAELNLLRQRGIEAAGPAGGRGGAPAQQPSRIHLDAGREQWTGEPSPEKRIEFLLVTVVPLVIVAALLWIACSNVANLLLARGLARRREIAIRLATGASRRRILGLLLGETLVLAIAGGALGVLVGQLTIDAVFATFSQFAAIEVQLDGAVLAYTAAISCLATVLAGLAPALEASRADVSAVLKAEGSSVTVSVRGARLRAAFLTVQVALALALLMVAGTFVRALVSSYVGADAARMDHLALAHVDLGPSAGNAPAPLWSEARAALDRVPGVRGVTVLDAASRTQVALTAVDGRPVPSRPFALRAIDDGYLRTADTPILHGHAVDAPAIDATGTFEALLNAAAARQVLREGQAVAGAVGRTLTLGGAAVQIAGVVDDGLIEPNVYRPTSAVSTSRQVTLLVRSDPPAAEMLGRLRTALTPVLPRGTHPLVATYRDANLRGVSALSRVGALLGGLALLLAGAGVAGSMAFHGRQRAREIAVRRTLGATTPAVLRLVGAQAGRITVVGIALGIGLGWLGTQALLALLGGPSWHIDWIATAGVSAVFAATIAVASFGPAWRAVRLEPSTILHTD